MQLLYAIAAQENLQLRSFQSLSGGDINSVYLLYTSAGKRVVKINDKNVFPAMFQQEALGLRRLSSHTPFRIPSNLAVGEVHSYAYLMMEYIETGAKNRASDEAFAVALAAMHLQSQAHFGWESHNYIGSLPQYNEACTTASDFMITQRLQPQLKLAYDNGYAFKKLDVLYNSIASILPEEDRPALIHGDLWYGNYLVDEHQQPVLIDPACSYASREMDIAMMQLFGGFSNAMGYYQEAFPLLDNWQERMDIYQLYYLLVHLNIFGSSYHQAVKSIILKYT